MITLTVIVPLTLIELLIKGHVKGYNELEVSHALQLLRADQVLIPYANIILARIVLKESWSLAPCALVR